MALIRKSVVSAIPQEIYPLLNVRGKDLLDTLGLPYLREVVSGVLLGRNVRQATEMLTRRRLSLISTLISEMFSNLQKQGIEATELYDLVLKEYFDKSTKKDAKIVLRWILGLTTKQVQNVMRSKEEEFHAYAADLLNNHLGILGIDSVSSQGKPELLDKLQKVGLENLVLFTTLGAQSLAIRGSEKSLYGKFFEKLILGSVLSVLEFNFSESKSIKEGTFWLSQTDKRESDATVIWFEGEAVRLDIGFIGPGNSEITLDKVSRYSKEIEISGKKLKVTTIIIVDRVGPKSSVVELAKAIDAHVIQMSDPDWVKKLSLVFLDCFDSFNSDFSSLHVGDEYIRRVQQGVKSAPLERIFEVAVATSVDSDVEEGLEED
jgi:hypothetical protein